MTYYHGTSSNYLPGILKDGLVYKPDNRWDMVVGERLKRYGSESGRDGYIYLTDEARVAEWYAVNRAAYMSATPRLPFKWTDYDGVVRSRAMKLADYQIEAYPCILEVDVNLHKLEEDMYSDNGFRYYGGISPNRLRLIWEGKAAQQLPKAA